MVRPTFQTVLSDALSLGPLDRERLLDQLLADGFLAKDIEQAWLAEAHRRLADDDGSGYTPEQIRRMFDEHRAQR